MSRVDHWASVRDKSVARIPTEIASPAPPVPEIDDLQAKLIEKEREIERLCAEIEATQLPMGPFAGKRIALAVAKAHGLKFLDMISHRRSAHLVRARQHAMWEMREHTKLSYPAIGAMLGGRDHTTVLHGVRQHRRRLLGEIE
jgi:chromosomal replication initiation ATPase DnaA